uniref:dolichyl-P-Man:Man5GlcNAc2-PP-dolichol alpha-1,3-mannosyltransferase n=1 Tax=Mesocestoides corti TaxID=53468 RepID=A0A5K3EXK3_MESCO
MAILDCLAKGKDILISPAFSSLILPFVWLADISFSIYVILKVAYTEIDWIAYMQQTETFLNGTLDYDQLIGQTGPCVYPAGHVYVCSILYFLTDHGLNIFKAQCIFLGVYALSLGLIFNIYRKISKVPLFSILIM